MASSSFLRSIRVTGGGEPVGAPRVAAVIDEAWSIRFAQGGVVMAAMLRAAQLVLGRNDLALASAAGTFCRPVPSGGVEMVVDVLRSGRNGAQVHVTLRADADADPVPNAVATVVSTAHGAGWPHLAGPSVPDELTTPPTAADVARNADDPRRAGLNFFQQTRWIPAAPHQPERMRGVAWFAFVEPPLEPDGAWVPAMLAVPADALGLAAVAPVVEAVGPITAPSLQISIQWYAPARGEWLGIDSTCFQNSGGVASGLAMLWNTDGALVATATQTAILRRT